MKTFVQILGIRSVQTYLLSSILKVNTGASNGIAKAGLHLQNEVKASIAGRRAEPTSVDTGRFVNSVDMTHTPHTATIFSNLNYSKYLEFGTSRIKARRHFNNSLDRNKSKIKDIIKGTIKL